MPAFSRRAFFSYTNNVRVEILKRLIGRFSGKGKRKRKEGKRDADSRKKVIAVNDSLSRDNFFFNT